jgi:hypothetical protein
VPSNGCCGNAIALVVVTSTVQRIPVSRHAGVPCTAAEVTMQSVEAMLQLLVFKQLLARRALQCSAFLQAVMRVLCTVVQSTVTSRCCSRSSAHIESCYLLSPKSPAFVCYIPGNCCGRLTKCCGCCVQAMSCLSRPAVPVTSAACCGFPGNSAQVGSVLRLLLQAI